MLESLILLAREETKQHQKVAKLKLERIYFGIIWFIREKIKKVSDVQWRTFVSK